MYTRSTDRSRVLSIIFGNFGMTKQGQELRNRCILRVVQEFPRVKGLRAEIMGYGPTSRPTDRYTEDVSKNEHDLKSLRGDKE